DLADQRQMGQISGEPVSRQRARHSFAVLWLSNNDSLNASYKGFRGPPASCKLFKILILSGLKPERPCFEIHSPQTGDPQMCLPDKFTPSTEPSSIGYKKGSV